MFNQLITSFIVTLVLLSAQASTVFAQTQVRGRVQDAITREVLPGAVIHQKNTPNTTTSGTEGTFNISLQSTALPLLEVRFLGYKTQEINVSGQTGELIVRLTPESILNEDVVVRGLRVNETSAFSYTNLSQKDVQEQNYGMDIPFLLMQTPSVVTNSDAGTGIGYTGIRIRGVDPQRINVTINGIPINDSESHGVFWVNMPDLASSIENIQVQRGVGTSTNGAAAFGASINIETNSLSTEPYARYTGGVGSFNTLRNTAEFGTGLLQNGWYVDGRLSKIDSDGYVDRSFSDLGSYALTLGYVGKDDLLRINVLSGREKTYQAWYGVPEARVRGDAAGIEAYILRNGLSPEQADNLRNSDRRYNFYTYDNETDNYAQDHYQIHYTRRISKHWIGSTSLHYTYGRGYYETFAQNSSLNRFGLSPFSIGDTTISRMDIIHRRWLDNHFYGIISNIEYQDERYQFTAGGGYNEYYGDHFGQIIWARYADQLNIREPYYQNDAIKRDGHLFAKLNWFLTQDITLYGDLQLRGISYEFLGKDRIRTTTQTEEVVDLTQTDRLFFFNPKAGVNVQLAPNQRWFASFAVGNKEPTRVEYVQSLRGQRPRHETLYDFETGYRIDGARFALDVTGYMMYYHNQLINTGLINDVGAYIRDNVDQSYRAGIETTLSAQLMRNLQWSGSLTLSQNKINRFEQFYDVYTFDDDFRQDTEVLRNVDIAFSPNVVANSMLRYTQKGFTVDWLLRHVGRQYLDNTQRVSRSINPYTVQDLRMNYQLSGWKKFSNIQIGLLVNNLLNTRYEANGYTFSYFFEDADGAMDLTTENYYYPMAGRNILTTLSIGF